MARTKKPKLIKICLTDRGEDQETPWAEDLGPAKGPKGSRKVKLVNVPFLHAKPTFDDIIVVSPVEDGLLTWDKRGVAWKDIGKRILEDSGRHAMIVDYVPKRGDRTGDEAFRALVKACRKIETICEGCYGPDGKEPGRAYLAVPDDREPEQVMKHFEVAKLPCRVEQIHPKPPKKKPARKTSKQLSTRRR